MNEREFEIGGKKFKLLKLDSFKQFHIVRRIAPIIGDVMKAAGNLKGLDEGKLSEDQKLEAIAKFASPIMEGLSKLSDQDADFILRGLCQAVEMEHVGSWARLVRDDTWMIQNLELPVLLQCAGRALMYNLSGFFAIAPQTSHGGK